VPDECNAAQLGGKLFRENAKSSLRRSLEKQTRAVGGKNNEKKILENARTQNSSRAEKK
jgi:hypothetical protein